MASDLFDFQKIILDRIIPKDVNAVLLTMGLGKTRITSEYMKARKFRTALVVAPKTLSANWIRHLEEAGFHDISVINAKTMPRLSEYLKGKSTEGVFITNYEFIRSRKADFLKMAPAFDFICLDESTYIKNIRSQVTKVMINVFRSTRAKMILSGTAMCKITDIYSQMEFLDPSFWGINYWQFVNLYVHFKEMTTYVAGRQVRFKKILGPRKDRLPGLLSLMRSKVNAVMTEDIDNVEKYLPREIVADIPVECPADLKKDYLGFKNDLLKEVGGIENSMNGAAKLVKLQQILACNDKPPAENNKFKLLVDMLENEIDTDSTPVIIWCRFTDTIEYLKRHLAEHFGKGEDRLEVFVIHGDTPPEERDRIVAYSNSHTRCLIIMQLQVGKFGLNFSTTSTAVYYELNFSLEGFQQSRARIKRLNSTSGTAINYVLFYEKTIDRYIFKALQDGLKNDDMIREIYKGLISE